MKKVKVNAIRLGVERSEKFYGLKARGRRTTNIRVSRVMVRIGHCSQLNYLSDKFDGRMREYYHRFKRAPEVLVCNRPQADGTEIIILRGKFKIESAGITG